MDYLNVFMSDSGNFVLESVSNINFSINAVVNYLCTFGFHCNPELTISWCFIHPTDITLVQILVVVLEDLQKDQRFESKG